MTKTILFRVCISALMAMLIAASCSKPVTLVSLLKEMPCREHLAMYPDPPYHLVQFSSYNRASVRKDRPGWFENNDMSHFIRMEQQSGRREFVMLDAEGPGAIVRWWMTFYKAQNGIIRIYLDNDSLPVASGAPKMLLSGKLLSKPPLAVSVQDGAPLGEAGRDYDHNLYFPIPFAQHCKVTYECDSLVLRYENEGVPVEKGYYWPDVFYNIGCRIYEKGTRVRSFSMKELKKAGPVADEAGWKLTGMYPKSKDEESFNKLIQPGDSLVLPWSREKSAINRVRISVSAPDMPQALRSTIIQLVFDGNRTVWVPVGEFFGSGYSMLPHQTWMNRRDENGVMESFWVMPFREQCTMTFINYGKESVSLKGSAGLEPFEWKEGAMYFGASWHEYHNLRTRDDRGSPFDINYIDINGKGIYAGDQVALFNNTYEWWGEGDEKIFVDGEAFPSSFGTGSEDYYGYSFARQESFSHPFICQPTGIGNMDRGLTVNMRHRSLDAIPFNRSISANIELWHWADIYMNYALTSYYYAMPPFKTNVATDPSLVGLPVAVKKIDSQ